MTSTPNRSPITPEMSPEDAASYWLARCDAQPATRVDPAFLAWLAASEQNAAVWARAETVWRQAADDLRDDPLTEALRATALAARPPIWPRALAAAAVVALAAVGGWYWMGRSDPASLFAPKATPAAPTLQLATVTGERRIVTLKDGTRLDLDSDTRVEVAFDGKARRLRLLGGRAFVQVARDPSRPLTFQVADQTIVDRGTEYSVSLMPGRIMVTLAQGSVAVGADHAPMRELKPGQRLVLQDGRAPRLIPVDLDAALAWRDGFAEFSDTPLSDAVIEMNRYGGRKIVVADPRVAAMTVSGRFKLGEPDRFLRTVSALLPVQAAPVGETIEVRAAPAASETPR